MSAVRKFSVQNLVVTDENAVSYFTTYLHCAGRILGDIVILYVFIILILKLGNEMQPNEFVNQGHGL